jgi:hypothetical protein
MLFTIDAPTEAKLTSLTPRSEHHGDSLVSALTLGLSITGPNTFLDKLNPELRAVIYTVADDYTPGLDGIDPPTPKLRTKLLGPLAVQLPAIEGGTLFIEWGIGEDMALGSTKVDKFRVEAMDGGTCTVSFRASTSDVSEEESGHLFGKLGQALSIRFEPPLPAPDTERVETVLTIDGTSGHPGAGPLFDDEPDATDAFVASANED